MQRMMIALVFAASSLAGPSTVGAIDWGSAGKADPQRSQTFQPSRQHQPEDAAKPVLPDSGFDCDTVTRMSWERPGGEREKRNTPEQVRRCSRDGFTFEVTPSSN